MFAGKIGEGGGELGTGTLGAETLGAGTKKVWGGVWFWSPCTTVGREVELECTRGGGFHMLCVGMVAATEAEGSGFVDGSGDVGWPDTRVLLGG